MNESQALVVRESDAEIIPHQPLPPPSLFGTADPVEVVARASRVAASLKEVIKAQGLISKISGKEYPRCEAWTLLGTMLGVFPVLVWTRPLEDGWEARVEARTRDGAVVGAAEAQCLKTERNWGNRDDFALRSMAQTRATAKALRMPLGFVMTLGGFQATPAEEMDFEKEPAKSAPSVNSKATTKLPPNPDAPATEEQRIRWIKQLQPIRDKAEAYGYANGILLPPGENDPGEPLECWPLNHTPSTVWSAQKLFQKIQAYKPAGAPEPPFTSAEAASRSSEGNLELNSAGSDDANEPPGGWQGATGAGDQPQYDESGDEILIAVGKLEQVSVKEGRSKKGPWVRYGLKINEDWYSTFDKNLGALAEKDKGSQVRVHYKVGERGADLVSIERA